MCRTILIEVSVYDGQAKSADVEGASITVNYEADTEDDRMQDQVNEIAEAIQKIAAA